MRKSCIILFFVLAAMLTATAQEHLSERVYVSTDRDVYVAGDEMFLSAFCLDMATGRLSEYSSVAYIEIISPEGPVQTAKIALSGGRGGGYIRLDNTIPTGQYGMVAYTAQCFNEDGYDFEEGERILSIINPFTDARSKAGDEWSVLERSIRHAATVAANYHHAWRGYRLNVNLNGRLQSKTYYGGSYENAPGFGVWNINTTHTLNLVKWAVIEPSLGVDNIFNRVDKRIDSSTRKYAL